MGVYTLGLCTDWCMCLYDTNHWLINIYLWEEWCNNWSSYLILPLECYQHIDRIATEKTNSNTFNIFWDINLWKKYFHNIGIHNLFWFLNKKQTYIIVKLCFIINNSRYYQNKHFTSENLVYILMAAMKIISLPRKLILVLDVVTELNVWISITEASHISHLCIWQLQNLGSVIVLHLHDIKDAVCALK